MGELTGQVGNDSGLVTMVRPLADTVPAGGAVKVLVVVRNDGKPTHFRNDPVSWDFTIVGPTGDSLTRIRDAEFASLGDVPDLVIPRGGIVGQTVDLTCATQPYSEAVAPGCLWHFNLEKAGRYSVVARYHAVQDPAPRTLGPMTLVSDTAHILVSKR
jgi:hypothetical protein